MDKLQTLLQPRADFRVRIASRQPVVEQRGDHRITLQHPHPAAHRRQHKRIAPQPRRGVHHVRKIAPLNADRFGHRFAATAAELTPVRHRATDKIDKNPAELGFVALA